MSGDAIFVGNFSYSINLANNTVQLTAAEIQNISTSSGTGTIRLELWLTTTPWNNNGSNTGYEIATDQLSGSSNGTLGTGQYFSNISNTVTYINHPPAGTYFITLVAAEYTGITPNVDGGFAVDSAQTFSNFLVVGSNGSVSLGGSALALPPVIALQNESVNANASIQASSLISSVTDPNNLAITAYDFRDDGADGGYLSLSGVKQAANTWITVSATDLSKLVYVGGSAAGSETVDVAAWDGQWSVYHSATATTVGTSLPVIVAHDQTVSANRPIQASTLIASVTDPNNLAITYYSFRDDGAGGGYLSLNGVKQVENAWVTVSAADLSKLVYIGGSAAGSEKVDVAAWDGQWSLYQTATATTAAASTHAPQLTIFNQAVYQNASIQASSLISSVTDPNNVAITAYDFRDDGVGGGYFSLNGVKQLENAWITVNSADLSKLVYVGGAGAGSEKVDVAAWDGQWSLYQTATVTTVAVSPPSIVVSSQTVKANSAIQAFSLVASVTDPNNLAVTLYDFRDNGSDGGYFSLSGVKQAASTWITVSVADLSKLVYVGGSGSGTETVDVAAWNGYAWSSAARASVITQATTQAVPAVITVSNQTVNENMSIQAQSLIASVTDPNNLAITYYDFRDDGAGGGYLSLNGIKQVENAWITVSAADLSKLVYIGGNAAGSETVDVAAWDGFAWSLYQSATVTTTLPQSLRPTVAPMNQSVNANASIQASSLISSVTDPNNLAITAYDFRDDGVGGGYFSLNGVKQLENAWITVNAADLSKLVYVGGTGAGSETVDVAASDGQWSLYQTATVTTVTVSPPVVLARDQVVSANASIQASTLIIPPTDPNNYPITSYEFRDNGAGGGYLSLSGVKQVANTWVTVSANDLYKLAYVGGNAAGNETVDVAVFNGHTWSAYTSAQVTTTGAAATNAVVALLMDPGIKADVAANVSGNSLSYADMLKILNDAVASGITSTEFSDLRTLVAHFDVSGGVAVSSYVSYISNKLVNGDASNANWTGGALTTSSLGNLAAGSSQTQINELVQKWFLGGDLPAPVFDTPGSVIYVQSSSPLYNLSGTPSINDINQGDLGDCYLLSSLAEVAQCEPGTIKSMITDNGNGTYGVRFYIAGNPVYVTVNSQLPVWVTSGAPAGNTSLALWSSLIEKAYVELNAEPGFLDHTTGNVYNLIDYGGTDPITQITGRSVTNYDSLHYTQASWGSVKSIIVTAIQSGLEVDVASSGASSIDGKSAFISHHMFSGIGYDTATGNFILRNPWGAEPGQAWWTQFEASMSDIYAEHSVIFIANGNVGSGPPLGALATLTVSAAVTNFQAGQLSLYSVLSDSVANVQSNLDTLQTLSSSGWISSITLTDGGTPVFSLTSAQFARDGAVLGCISGNHAFSLTGSLGNDTIDLSSCRGNDHIDGGAGIDTVVFTGARSSHTVTQTSFGWTVSSGPDGTDTIQNVERLQFSDETLALDINGDAGQAYRVYQAAFNRTPDNPGLKFWIGVMDSGASLHDVAAGFINSAEFQSIYGSNPTNEQFVTNLYAYVMHRPLDQAGYDFWVGDLNANRISRIDTLVQFSEAAENQANVIGVIQNGIELFV